MPDEDLDRLSAAEGADEFWHVLNTIVTRMESRSATMDRPSEETA
jgi:hypothetical protein